MNHQKKQISEKELAMYQAVVDLIEENVDINSIKVSDITNRAGIGKGTAYEYFSSKDEMVAKTLLWRYCEDVETVLETIAKCHSLEEQILAILEFIRTQMRGKRFYIFLLNVQGHSCDISESLKKEVEKTGLVYKNIGRIMDALYEQGVKENKIPLNMKKTYIFMVLFPGFISYFMYLNAGCPNQEVEEEELKQFICKNMMQSFQRTLEESKE